MSSPRRVIVINLDDARWDDLHAVMTTGPRAGERVMEQTLTRLVELGVQFTGMRSDKAFCGPSRAALLTGYNSNNHNIGTNTVNDYYPHFREGRRVLRDNDTGSATWWCGPWERDLALQAGLATTPVNAGSQPLGTQSSSIRTYTAGSVARGEAVYDDLQASTGNLVTALANVGVTCALIGKYENAYSNSYTLAAWNGVGYGWTGNQNPTRAEVLARTGWSTSKAAVSGADPVVGLVARYVPPGWTYWHCLDGDSTEASTDFGGGAQNHWNVRVNRYEGANPATGDGHETDGQDEYHYRQTLVGLTRVGAVATAQHTAHGLSVGDEIFVTNTANLGWAGQTTATVGGFLQTYCPSVATVIDADHYTYPLNPTTIPAETTAVAASGGTILCYPRRYYGENVWLNAAVQFMETRDEDEPFFLYYAPDNPHDGQSQGADDSSVECEQRYLSTIDPTTAFTFGGLPGWVADKSGPCTWSSTAGTAGSTTRRTVTSATRRYDGSGPFNADDVGKPLPTSVYPAGTVVASVDSSLPGSTGGSFVASADPTTSGTAAFLTIGTEVTTVSEVNSARRQAWVRRQEMLASVDDTVGAFLDAIAERGWNNVTLILTSDNGWQQGEKNSAENNAAPSGGGGAITNDQWSAKVMAWEGSVRSMLFIYNPPFWASDSIAHFPVAHHDIPLTVLDFFGERIPSLLTHHMHTKRDGMSIVRLLADATTAWARGVLIERGTFDQGLYATAALASANSSGEGVVRGHRKYIRHLPGQSGAAHLFDVRNDGVSYPDYESTDLAPTNVSEAADLDRLLNLVRSGRWLATVAAGAPTVAGTQTYQSAR